MTKWVGKYFKDDEFVCRGCKTGLVHLKLVEILDATRKMLGTPLEITSGVRCHEPGRCIRNSESGGRPNSLHIPQTLAVDGSKMDLGLAADVTYSKHSQRQPINIARLYITLERASRIVGVEVGLGHYTSWVHLDCRSLIGKPSARWEEHVHWPRL